MQKWQLASLTAALCAALAVSACGDQTAQKSNQTQTPTATTKNSQPGKGAVIGFAHCCIRGEISTMDSVEDTIKQVAEERGAKLLYANAEDSKHRDDADFQVNQVKQLIDQGAKVVILITSNGKKMKEIQQASVEYAQSKGAYIIAARRPLPKAIHSRFGNAFSVSSSTEAAGLHQGKMVANMWKQYPEWDKNGDGKVQYGILQGLEGNPKTIARTKNFLNAMNADGREVERIATADTDWERNKAKEAVAQWIKSGQINKMEILVANSDDLALGGLDALKEANKPLLPIFGLNAIDEAQEAIKKGEMAGSVLQDVPQQGRVAYRLAENLALGKRANDGIDLELEGGHTINVPYAIVTKVNENK